MSDQGTSDAYRQIPHSPMDEGTSQPNPGYTADSDFRGYLCFQSQTEEPFPPEKRGWFSRAKSERRKG
ncbi:hypothetical protein Hanom_Chr02g00112601 [Helianthus anomalus]